MACSFFRVDGLADAAKQLAAGRPVVAGAKVLGNVFFEPGPGGDVRMSRHDEELEGLHSILLTGFAPGQQRYRFLNNWGVDWGDGGFGSMTLDVARRLLDPEQLWSVALASQTVDDLLEQRVAARTDAKSTSAGNVRRPKHRGPSART